MKGYKKKLAYSHFRAGTPIPKVSTPVHDGVYLEFNGFFSLICAMNRPTAKEKNAFRSGVPQFDLVVVDGVIFFLSRFGTLNWMDSPFNRHLYSDNRILQLEEPGPTQGYSLHVMLIDSVTGVLVHQRLIGLDHDLSMRLRDAIINQPVIPDYDQRVRNVMARYSTKDLVTLASSHPASSKAQSGTATSVTQLRPSQRGLSGIKKDDYPLPEELSEFNFFYSDGTGHVVMAIPESLLPQAIKSGNFDDFECPIPCRYILAKGYRFLNGHVICDAPYSEEFGVDVDEFWFDE